VRVAFHQRRGPLRSARGLAIDIGDERLLRQDWITGETPFLRALSLPLLAEQAG